ncbi:hypothetical protein ACLB2K_011743 [Fragaria x ananassa]
MLLSALVWLLVIIGMENEDMNSKQAKTAETRRKWTNFEEDALFFVLNDFVSRGLRCETGSFKSGTLLQMEKSLELLCPGSNLKAYPHIESKLKKWKQNFSIVYDMTNTSGFAWNDAKKCIEVDSNDAWDMYVQHNKNAKGWRNKSFPIYDRLALIFGKDRANGRGAETPADMAESQSMNDINSEQMVNDVSPVSLNQESSQTEGSRKRKRVDETDKLVGALEKVFEESGKRMQMVTEAILKGNEDRSDIAKELKNMGLSVDDQIVALGIILERPQNISIFKSLDDDVRRVYVQNLLMSNR